MDSNGSPILQTEPLSFTPSCLLKFRFNFVQGKQPVITQNFPLNNKNNRKLQQKIQMLTLTTEKETESDQFPNRQHFKIYINRKQSLQFCFLNGFLLCQCQSQLLFHHVNLSNIADFLCQHVVIIEPKAAKWFFQCLWFIIFAIKSCIVFNVSNFIDLLLFLLLSLESYFSETLIKFNQSHSITIILWLTYEFIFLTKDTLQELVAIPLVGQRLKGS